jgi:hypothetical protein
VALLVWRPESYRRSLLAQRCRRQFLIYKDFYTAERPVVMCEGETDNIYLTYAIRSLAAEFPELAKIAPDGKISLKVRPYNTPNRVRRGFSAGPLHGKEFLGVDSKAMSTLARAAGRLL